MNTTKAIWFTSTRAGTRAYFWSYAADRSMPIALSEALVLVATGQAEQVCCNPLKECTCKRASV